MNVIDAMFEALNYAGLAAYPDYACCSTCGIKEIEIETVDELNGMEEQEIENYRDLIKGYAFYSQQFTADQINKQKVIYLQYGQIQTNNYGNFGLPTVEVGKLIVSVLDNILTLYCEWDGSDNSAIKVVFLENKDGSAII